MRILILFITTFLTVHAFAQYVPMDIPLVKNGINMRNAWAGGLNLPQFSEVDLNNDGIKDLVVYDREESIASTFINNGTAGQVDYTYAPAYMKRLPQRLARNFMLLRDYNCDGIEDVFMYNATLQGLGLAVWEGSYDANDTIQYTLVVDRLMYSKKSGNPFPSQLFIYNGDLPAIDDVDGDGDIDILAFTLSSRFPFNIHWYRNMSMENSGNCDSLEYVLESECWGLFQESGDSNKVSVSPSVDSCYNNPYFNLMQRVSTHITQDLQSMASNSRSARDVGASLTLIDFNGDGVKDMILGGNDYTTANMISGVEINDTILITTQHNFYPTYDASIDIYTFPGMYFLDVNNDGKKDMLAAPSKTAPGGSIKDSVAWYYQNTGTNANMIFDFQQKDFLVGEMLDVGEDAYPVLLDYNADGLMDLLIGGLGRCQYGGNYEYGMTLLENTGTLSSPSFEYITNNYAGTDSLQKNGLYPTIGDLDGDGDMDMICGMQDGTLSYFENTAGVGNPIVLNAPVHSFFNIDVGGRSTPQLVDLDRDLDLDLVIGRRGGTIHYYENTGTSTNPVFSSSPTTNTLGGYSLQGYSDDPMPFVYDNNGTYELFIGHWIGGNIIQLGNIEGNILGTYDTLSQNYKDFYQGWSTHFSMADLNNDNKLDYIMGTSRGGVIILEEKDTITTVLQPKIIQKVVHLYPNPAKETVHIRWLEDNAQSIELRVYNALGQLILEREVASGDNQYVLDVSSLAAGVLFLEVRAGDYQETLPFVKE
ncbi:T9SS type A sorting domain-containing protein [Aureispira sp. CCB-QB1]|uniref:T9SS type A sorting domain-containing protein n=1 Tax=Aureispira sp. CCB-QB1 TaxID=1313421 RepID=UPI000698B2EC|nr:T9SS type A sorting domain-containing protein [Aureispira sp. CCB-QB1]